MYREAIVSRKLELMILKEKEVLWLVSAMFALHSQHRHYILEEIKTMS